MSLVTEEQFASNELIQFVSRETSIPESKIRLDSSLVDDLGIVGKDGETLVKNFGRKFSVDVSIFPWDEYFGKESSGSLLMLLIPRFREKLKPLLVKDLLVAIELGRLEPRKMGTDLLT